MAVLSVSLRGKTALVTGATNGIGKEAAIAFAAAGAEVVIVGRNPTLVEATVAEIIRSTGNPKVDGLVGDLSSQTGVRRVAAEFLASGRPLHILLNNAGALVTRFQESADGIEMTWALNHLGYFLLTHLLLERIRQSGAARIVNVSSVAHWFALNGIHFGDPQYRSCYIGYLAYAQSKLANILFTRELARRLAGSPVTVNAAHPGIVASQFGQQSASFRLFSRLLRRFRRSVQRGAETSIYLCTSPEVAGISGEYFADCRIAATSYWARSEAVARRLWELSARMTNIG